MLDAHRMLAVNAAFYGCILLVSLALLSAGWLGGGNRTPLRLEWRSLLLALIGTWAFYFITGVYFTAKAGAHSGDEGHFMIQAESLWKDHDLDIKNNLYETVVSRYVMRRYGRADAEPNVPKMRHWFHVSRFSREPHWYSWHSPGLSVLLAPVFPLGKWGRHAVLALIAAFAVCGLLKLCESFGSSRNAAFLTIGLTGISAWWGIYALRALPEVLGCGLAAWMMVGVMSERGHGWRAVGLTSLCAAALPWAYARFIPVGIMGFGFCALRCFFLEETWRARLAKANVLAAIVVLSFGSYYLLQHSMFVGSCAFDAREHLLNEPLGMWLMFSDKLGIGHVFPAAGWLVLGTCCLAVGDARLRRPSLALLSLFVAVLITSCDSESWCGGACLPGRFLIVVLPLLVAPASVVFERQGVVGRWWLVALLLFSAAHFALVLAWLPELGRHFATPTHALRLLTPWFKGLVNGFDFAGPRPVHSLAIAFYVITGVVLVLGRRRQALQAAMLSALIAAMAVGSWPIGAATLLKR